MDDVIDFIDKAANRLVTFRITEISQDAIKLAQIIVEAKEEVVNRIGELRQLDKIYPHCIEINRLEIEGDAVSRKGLARLYEDSNNRISIIKLKDFYEDLELATDRCEDVANVLEAMASKKSVRANL